MMVASTMPHCLKQKGIARIETPMIELAKVMTERNVMLNEEALFWRKYLFGEVFAIPVSSASPSSEAPGPGARSPSSSPSRLATMLPFDYSIFFGLNCFNFASDSVTSNKVHEQAACNFIRIIYY